MSGMSLILICPHHDSPGNTPQMFLPRGNSHAIGKISRLLRALTLTSPLPEGFPATLQIHQRQVSFVHTFVQLFIIFYFDGCFLCVDRQISMNFSFKIWMMHGGMTSVIMNVQVFLSITQGPQMLSGGTAGLVSVEVLRREREANRKLESKNMSLEGQGQHPLRTGVNTRPLGLFLL